MSRGRSAVWVIGCVLAFCFGVNRTQAQETQPASPPPSASQKPATPPVQAGKPATPPDQESDDEENLFAPQPAQAKDRLNRRP